MNPEIRFERAARNRQILAISIALILHFVVFAAVAYPDEVVQYIPDFIKEIFGSNGSEVPIA